MKQALRAYLLAQASISTLVGTRIYWGVRPQGSSLPAIVLSRISGGGGQTYKSADTLRTARIQMDSLGASNAEAEAICKALITALNGKSFAQEGVQFQGCFLDSERDLTDAGTTDAETIFRPSIDFQILFKE